MTTKGGYFEERLGLRGRVGDFVYRCGLLRPLQGMRRWLHKDLRILAYHRVLDIPGEGEFDFDLDLISARPDRFREQMKLLKQRFHPVRLRDAIATMVAGQPLTPGSVAVTFDDGYDDNYRVAFPILKDLGIPATFFVSTGHIQSGQPFAYDWLVHMLMHSPVERLNMPEVELDIPLPPGRNARRRLAGDVLRHIKLYGSNVQVAAISRIEREWNMPRDKSPPDCRPMNWIQLREMRDAGFDIGSHGVHHRMLAKLSQEQLMEELSQSRADLQRELGIEGDLLAYPVGGDLSFDKRVIAAVQKIGYMAACSYIFGINRRSSLRRYALYRLPVEREMDTGWFVAMLTLPGLMGYPTQNRADRKIKVRPCSS